MSVIAAQRRCCLRSNATRSLGSSAREPLTLQLIDDLNRLAAFGRLEDGSITRLAWSPELDAANEWLRRRFEGTGLEVTEDSAGNVFGEWRAHESNHRLLIGSHIDTVRAGGRYDGALGVLGGLAALELLRDRSYRPRRPFCVASFMDEEGVRFGLSMFGSRAFAGADLAPLVAEVRDSEGTTISTAMQRHGHDLSRLHLARDVERVAAYFELHIEQGPVLEREGYDIGVVSGVVGILHFRVTLHGEANHAGTTPMNSRRDAFIGAARVALALREEASARSAVATIGELVVAPGAFNVVPARCSFSVDYRVAEPAQFARAENDVRDLIARVADEESLEANVELRDCDPPVAFDKRLMAIVEEAADAEGVAMLTLPSGAGHDAMVIAAHAPAAMLFVPSREGVSHSGREYTSDAQCEIGARVLARAIELADRAISID